MAKLKEKREQSINQLVDAALKLFSEHGYEATSIRSIASEAGVSLGLLYNYFTGKEELLVEIFRRSTQDIQATFRQDVQPGQPQVSRIERHIRQTVAMLKEKKVFWKLVHGIRMQSPVVRQLVAEYSHTTAFIQEQIQLNLAEIGVSHPQLEAKLLFASIDGMAHQFLLLDDYPIDEVATLLIAKYKQKNG